MTLELCILYLHNKKFFTVLNGLFSIDLGYTGWSRIIGTVMGNVDVATVLLMPRLQNPTSFIKTTFFNPLLHENSINIVQNFEKSCQ